MHRPAQCTKRVPHPIQWNGWMHLAGYGGELGALRELGELEMHKWEASVVLCMQMHTPVSF